MKRRVAALAMLCAACALASPLLAAGPRQAGPGLSVLDRSGAAVSRLSDGDTLKLRVQAAAKVAAAARVVFRLADDDVAVGECTIAAGGDSCETGALRAYGWHWGKDGKPRAARSLSARSDGGDVSATASPSVAPRPVVMVHGFSSSADAWTAYLGPSGYLAAIGVPGFAVGDGQVAGTLNTGSLANPTGRTNTLDENARILGTYIANVKQKTGAQQVDLVVHSMGGLIARYYIARVMGERDVAQLLMLGSPNLGTECANLPTALNFYLPAALEIRPSYVTGIFNRQITRRQGVPFYMGAGVPIADPVKSPCADVPSDLAISRASVSGVPGTVVEVPLVHMELNTSRDVFDAVVGPFLRHPAGQFPEAPDPAPAAEDPNALQFTRVFTGHVNPGESRDYTVNLDSVAVASFALFDPSRSVTVTVRGATGNVIALDPRANGLVVVDDPASLLQLGYGFNNPRPGPWRITVQSTPRTPATGADFAMTAQVRGGPVLKARTSALLPLPGEAVRLTARLERDGQPLAIREARAIVRAPSGRSETVTLAGGAGEWSGSVTPGEPGLHAVDVIVSANGADNLPIERSAFLAFDVQPAADSIAPYVALALLIGGVLLLIVAVFVLVRRLRRRSARG